MKNKNEHTIKMVYTPVDIQFIRMNFVDIINTSSAFSSFYGEDDPLYSPSGQKQDNKIEA